MGSERRLNALRLAVGDQAGKHFHEVSGARVDVLPPLSLAKCRLDRLRFGFIDRAAAFRCEVACVGFGLGLKNAVDRGEELDELVDCPVAFLGAQLGVVAHPFKLLEDRCWLSFRQ